MMIDSVDPWQDDDGDLAGAALVVRFPAPVSGTFEFFSVPTAELRPGRGTGKPVPHELSVRDMVAVHVRLDLRSGQVVEFSPGDGTLIDGSEQAPPIPAANGRGGN